MDKFLCFYDTLELWQLFSWQLKIKLQILNVYNSISEQIIGSLIQRSPKYDSMGQIWCTAYFWNKVLLEHRHVHLFTYYLWMLQHQRLDALQGLKLYFLSIYRERLLISGLSNTKYPPIPPTGWAEWSHNNLHVLQILTQPSCTVIPDSLRPMEL